jgi:N-terminal domain of anti-restriction factor ArdC
VRASREQIQQEALSRAASGQSFGNWPAILAGFAAKGIPEADIRPRENVFTYHAWRALGRQVRRGEHGIKVVTFVTVDRRADPPDAVDHGTGPARRKSSGRRPWSATVFHVSQTDPVNA